MSARDIHFQKKPTRRLRGWAVALAVFAGLHMAYAEDSWQVWLDQTARKHLSDKSSVRAGQSLRFEADTGDLAAYYLEMGYVRRPLSWLDLGLAYRQQYTRSNGHWIEENRPYADVTPRWTTRMVTIYDRNQLEYRRVEGQDDTARYRNKLTLQLNAWGEDFGLKPYLSVETFINESVRLNESNRNRFTAGIRTDPERGFLRVIKFQAHHSLSMDYYITTQRTKTGGAWEDMYIAGVQLGVDF